jgi:hypothetical protein
VFKFLLRLEDGEPYDPAVFVTVIPSWSVGETFLVTAHPRLRILAVDYDLDDEFADQGINWTGLSFSRDAGFKRWAERPNVRGRRPCEALSHRR